MNTWIQWFVKAVASTCFSAFITGIRDSSEGLGKAISRLPDRVSVDLEEPAISASGIPLNNDFVGCANSMPTEMTLETIQIKTRIAGQFIESCWFPQGKNRPVEHICQDIFKSIPEKSGNLIHRRKL